MESAASSGTSQVYDAASNEWQPNRALSPLVITPVVTVNTSDGSLKSPYGNTMLADMKWYVDGVDITTIADWQGLYEINTNSTSIRGSITIKKNIKPSEVVTLRFEGVVADIRLGANIPIISEDITLTCTDKSSDQYHMTLEVDSSVIYNPMLDKLLLYEYKVAHGLQTENASARVAAIDPNAYERKIPVTVWKGKDIVTSGYILKLYSVNTSSIALTELTATGQNEVIEIGADYVKLDLRLVTERGYMIKAFAGAEEVGRVQFTVTRQLPVYSVRPTNGTAIAPTDTQRYDVAMVDCNGNIVECAESVLRMIWHTATSAKSDVVHNEGGSTLFNLADTGIGNTYADDWLDIFIESEYKLAHEVAADESGNVLTDENGETLIFN